MMGMIDVPTESSAMRPPTQSADPAETSPRLKLNAFKEILLPPTVKLMSVGMLSQGTVKKPCPTVLAAFFEPGIAA